MQMDMKRILLTALLTLVSAAGFACTNLIVGKAASVDGSVMCTYNCDGFGFASPLTLSVPGRHAPGEMLAVRGWGPQSPVHYVAQADYTYGVVGLMNELQVTIVETTWDGRKELARSEGALDYFTLMNLALQRSASAREAIEVMHNLVQEYGYNATGESFAVCDKDEAWIMELIGKGPGRKGAVWVAMRVPDDCISAYANSSRIRQFPQAKKADKKKCIPPMSSLSPARWGTSTVRTRTSVSGRPTVRWTGVPSATARPASGVSSAITMIPWRWTAIFPS